MNVAPRPWVGRSRVCFCFFTKIIFKLTIDISMCKIILEVEYFIKSMIYQMLKFFKRIAYFIPRWSKDLYFSFEDRKKSGLLIFNSLKQKKLIFNFFVNRNWKKLTDSRKKAKILADNRKSHHPIETFTLETSVSVDSRTKTSTKTTARTRFNFNFFAYSQTTSKFVLEILVKKSASRMSKFFDQWQIQVIMIIFIILYCAN